jgi:hypothetical protein
MRELIITPQGRAAVAEWERLTQGQSIITDLQYAFLQMAMQKPIDVTNPARCYVAEGVMALEDLLAKGFLARKGFEGPADPFGTRESLSDMFDDRLSADIFGRPIKGIFD